MSRGKKLWLKGPVREKVESLMRRRIRLSQFRARHRHSEQCAKGDRPTVECDHGQGLTWTYCAVCDVGQTVIKDV